MGINKGTLCWYFLNCKVLWNISCQDDGSFYHFPPFHCLHWQWWHHITAPTIPGVGIFSLTHVRCVLSFLCHYLWVGCHSVLILIWDLWLLPFLPPGKFFSLHIFLFWLSRPLFSLAVFALSFTIFSSFLFFQGVGGRRGGWPCSAGEGLGTPEKVTR